MDIGSILLGLALLLLIAFVVVQPFFEGQGVREKKISEADQLIAEREQVLAALRDLDFDHTTGKITNEDYTLQRMGLVAQGAAVLKQLDALKPPEQHTLAEDEIEQAVQRKRAKLTSARIDDRIEADVAARCRSTPAAQPNPAVSIEEITCSRCGTAARVGDQFCSKCGSTLALACAGCGHSLQPGDRYCPGCGAKQAAAEATR